ncbi:MAG: general stress protein [Aggregatilineales bacterium]
MTSTVLATFDSSEDAHDAIHDLTESGFNRSDIGLAVYDRDNKYVEDISGSEGAGIGAVAGSIFGGIVGLAAITIPGVGPVIAAGPLAAAIGALAGAGVGAASGAVTGGITGSLVKFNVPEDEADYYAESLRQGAALVSVTAHEFDADRAMAILRDHNPIDIDKRVAQWRARGWDGYDPKVDPFTAEQRAEFNAEYDADFETPAVTSDDEVEEYRRAVRHFK